MKKLLALTLFAFPVFGMRPLRLALPTTRIILKPKNVRLLIRYHGTHSKKEEIWRLLQSQKTIIADIQRLQSQKTSPFHSNEEINEQIQIALKNYNLTKKMIEQTQDQH